MYKEALKNHYRFQTVRGELTTEDLWVLPLTSKDGFDLDTVARTLAKKIRETEEESFVKPKPSNEIDKKKLEIVKDIIADKIAERDKAKETKAKAERKQKILEILAKKQDASLEAKSEEELLKELEAL